MSEAKLADVRVARHMSHAAERVFDAWLNPAVACKWLFATPNGTVVRAEIDARPGGAYTIVDRRDGEDVAHTGIYQEIVRPKRLAFTLVVEKYSKEVSRIVVDVFPTGGGCEVVLTHQQVVRDFEESTKAGWSGLLARLDAALDES